MVVCSLVSIVSKKAVRDVARRLDLKVGAAGSTVPPIQAPTIDKTRQHSISRSSHNSPQLGRYIYYAREDITNA